ncbi:MAG: MFS transporter [Pseudomonadota bacterium]|nr:MFS transporter [Pseudomonadota bacterium]
MALSKPRKTLAACCGVHAIHDGISDILYVLLPLLKESFNLTFAEIGMIRGAHRAALAIFQLPAGLLAERVGERNLLVVGTAIAGLAYIGLGLSSGFVALLAILFFVGLGSAVQHPLSASIISSAYATGPRRAALGTYAFAGDVGKFAFAGGLGLLIAAGIDWRGPVVSLGVFTVLAAVVVLFVLLAVQIGGRPEKPQERAEEAKVSGWGIREPIGFGALLGIMIVDNCTRNGFLTFVAFLLIAGNVDTELAAMAIPAILLGGMWGKLACGVLAERVGIIRTVIITEIGTAIGIVVMIFVEGDMALFILPLLGTVLNGTSSVLQGTIGDLVDQERQSRAFGLFFAISAACGIAAPLGFGLLADAISIPTTMFVIAGIPLLTFPLCLVLSPILRAAASPAE